MSSTRDLGPTYAVRSAIAAARSVTTPNVKSRPSSRQAMNQTFADVGRPSSRVDMDSFALAMDTKASTVKAAHVRLLTEVTAHRVRGSMKTFEVEGVALGKALQEVRRCHADLEAGVSVDHLDLSLEHLGVPLQPEDLHALLASISLCLPQLRRIDLTALKCTGKLVSVCAKQLADFVRSMPKLRGVTVDYTVFSHEQQEAMQRTFRRRRGPRALRGASSSTAPMNDDVPDDDGHSWSAEAEAELAECVLAEHCERVDILFMYIHLTAQIAAAWHRP